MGNVQAALQNRKISKAYRTISDQPRFREGCYLRERVLAKLPFERKEALAISYYLEQCPKKYLPQTNAGVRPCFQCKALSHCANCCHHTSEDRRRDCVACGRGGHHICCCPKFKKQVAEHGLPPPPETSEDEWDF